MARIFRVCYMEQPFDIEELDRYDRYFEYSGCRRILSQDSVRAMEDDHMTYDTCTDEECNLEGYPNNDEYDNFRDKIGECYDLLLNNEIDFVEFE